ncbi:MAG: SH3 domain-containing protein [Holosporaceae bacterium]|nr:SH3 domain-containing protein [Holosporaceae bacterium]
MRIFQFWWIIFFMLEELPVAFASQFVSLKSSEVNLRVGPGKEYPVSWVFMRNNLPMLLIAEFEQWRKIKFMDGTEGWVHQNMISRKSTAVVVSENAILYQYATNSQPTARVEKGVVVRILKKENEWVKIEINKIKGWMHSKELWGLEKEL